MLRRWCLNTQCISAPFRDHIPKFGSKSIFQIEPEQWDISGRPPPIPENDPTTGWTQQSKRCGVLAQKVGMSHMWDDWLEYIPLTALFIPGCQVISQKLKEKDGYTALQVGAGYKNPKKLKKPVLGHLLANGVKQPKAKIVEFRVTEDALLPSGTDLTANHFAVGQLVDVTGTSKGKGWQGVMKRWGFSGNNASHGASKSHRSAGSTGACQDPGKVWKGKKMSGKMGADRSTVKNLLVYKVDPLRNVVYVRGSVPGPNKGWIRLIDAKNKKFAAPPPFPTYVRSKNEDLSEKTFFSPKSEDLSWEIEDIEKNVQNLKSAEKEKITAARDVKSVQRQERKVEYHKQRKVKQSEVKQKKQERKKEIEQKRKARLADTPSNPEDGDEE